MKSITKISQNNVQEKWYLVDGAGLRIGTLASKVSELLQHKNDALYRPNLKPMVKVVVINSDKLDIPEKKGMSKFYKNYSGFPGGLRFTSLEDLMKKDSTKVIFNAVHGMLPKTKRGADMLGNLYIYRSESHKHEANQPEKIDILKIKL